MDNHQDHLRKLRELYSVSCGSLNGQGERGKVGESGYLYMYGCALRCLPETATTLLIGYIPNTK